MPALGDVVARARGLVRHLLPESALVSLARSSGAGALADALAREGYPRVSEEPAQPLSAIEVVEAAIERETARRLGVIARWLGPRRALFVGVFEEEERRVLRILLRRVASGTMATGPRPSTALLTSLGRRSREALAGVADVPAFVRVLARAGSPHAPPLIAALRAGESRLVDLEAALDRNFTWRAHAAARRAGGDLLAWVEQSIDLENVWAALQADDAHFLEGGARLSRDAFETVARKPGGSERRADIARVFATDPLGEIFADERVPQAALEGRSRLVRRRGLERTARRDPLGPAALLELVMRLREEPARLRRIAWAVAQGVSEAAHAEAWTEVAA